MNIHVHTCSLSAVFLCRDRVPFVLTRDMAYVINGGDCPSAKFQVFTDLCCAAYNVLRKHTGLIVSLLSLVCTSIFM